MRLVKHLGGYWWLLEDRGKTVLARPLSRDKDLGPLEIQKDHFGYSLPGPGTNFEDMDLRHADLRGMDLRYSRFYRANLGFADLRGANLSGADLRWCNLYCARLDGTKLHAARRSGPGGSDHPLPGWESLEGTLTLCPSQKRFR